MFIDSHAHLQNEQFDNDIEIVYKKSLDNSVGRIINIGYDLNSCKKTIEIINRFEHIWGTVGMHPHDAINYNKNFEENLFLFFADKKIIGLGEIGLDYFKEYSPIDIQKKVFIKQLEIAKEKELPVVIHCRDAYDDCYEILKSHNVSKGVMHCFSGDEKEVERFLSLGFYISFTGTVTFRKNDLKAVKATPVDRLLLETDCPYMTPVPFRGKRNDPSYIPIIAQKIASVHKVDVLEIEEKTTENVYRLFKRLS
ncbi:MAG: TatD family hydrolase [Candidatus Muirbacterium halophilum]|nr:TatD family hydrolase [Candidatus Muirbacterium halophilum]